MNRTKTAVRRLLLVAVLLSALVLAAAAADSPEAFFREVEQHLRAQDKNFTVSYNGDRSDLGFTGRPSFGPLQRVMMARSPDGPDSADYCCLNINEAAITQDDGVYTFVMDYLNTPAQLAEVDKRVPEIVGSLGIDGADDVTRVTLIYEYVCSNFLYDTSETKYSAYDGLTTGSMVCQGYSQLISKMMWHTGIPCRIVVGTSQNQTHAWNIVKLDGQWYNLDATWDGRDDLDAPMSWNYFLKSEADFKDHTRFSELLTEAYTTAHPVAAESRGVRRVVLQSGEQELVNLVVRTGNPTSVDAILPEGASAPVEWRSSDPEILRVDPDGTLRGQKPGRAILTADAPELRGTVPASITVFVVDLTKASPWAFDTVTRYYLNQLLPVELCSDFQNELTRAELAKLCHHYVLHVRGWEPATLRNPYSDIDASPFAVQIVRCRDAGLMDGVSADEFNPQGKVTREQAATVLYRLIDFLTEGAPKPEGAPQYADAAQISAWAAENVAAVSESGIFRGSDGLFRPKDTITRQEMVVAMDRIFDRYPVEKLDFSSEAGE